MTSLRLLLLGSLFALATPFAARAQQKPTYPDTEAAQHAGEEATVTGKVVTVSKSSKGSTFMNFGDRFPKQTFSGVIFAKDEEKVGDLKQYEGKSVAVTGKIELSPDQKPQIVIKSADQIKPADEAPAAPPVAMVKPPVPAAMPMPSTPGLPATPPPTTPAPSTPVTAPPATAMPAAAAAAATKKMVLAPNWNSATQGGDMVRKDLAMLFGTVGSASDKTEGDPSLMVYPEVPFLAPAAAAKKALNLDKTPALKSKVTCPGIPLGSFSSYAFSGVFAGGFNRLYLITDNADQVVSVLLVDENSRQRTQNLTDTSGYHTYNFINTRVKGTNDLVIRHDLAPDAPAGLAIVDSVLVDPKDPENTPKTSSSKSFSSTKSNYTQRTPKTGKVLERSRWYVPIPVVNLIMRCVGSR